MLGKIPFDDFSPYRASGRSTLQVLSLEAETIYVCHTLAMCRHGVYLVEKHIELIPGRDVLTVPLPEALDVIPNHPTWFIEVDHWARTMLPGRLWELVTSRNHEVMEVRLARYTELSNTQLAGGVPADDDKAPDS